ncbi:hypothetical protein OG453_44790 [Streptomyces sp. NBC_01381]|uniref:hypothetical protein n=1 Tax=Streptomyces sp. NBC_01381 TaxID=2903845 RepID=UPI00224E867B|nr:hypothetical protein [Streptomyces sp. NBC_01381]MCX4673677.1 hypothetical protein [Streptomyces sp. NBC_01381]
MSDAMSDAAIDLSTAWDLLEGQEERVPVMSLGEARVALELAHWISANDEGEAGELAAAFVVQLAGRIPALD